MTKHETYQYDAAEEREFDRLVESGQFTPDDARRRLGLAATAGAFHNIDDRPVHFSDRAMTAPGAEDHYRVVEEHGRPDDQDLNGMPPVR